VVLRDGRPVEAGSHQALLAHDGLYAHLYHLQAGPPPQEAGVSA
jgi:ABC-type multidrug transport system fused ATPase/permease subunit